MRADNWTGDEAGAAQAASDVGPDLHDLWNWDDCGYCNANDCPYCDETKEKTMDVLAEARADLAAATPGPWELRQTSTVYMDGTGVCYFRAEGVPGIRGMLTVTRPDADHIARFDPPTVLAMLDALEAAREFRWSTDRSRMKRQAEFDAALEVVRTLIGDNE
jgi:hypothetical protein